MLVCPRCGHKARHGEYCIRCGAHLALPGAPKPHEIRFLAAVIAAALVLAGILVFGGFLSSPTRLLFEVASPPVCGEDFGYSVRLVGADGEPLAGQQVSFYVGESLVERLRTDQNGRFSSSGGIQAGLCGKQTKLWAEYRGDLLHTGSSNGSLVVIQIPTELVLAGPLEATNDTAVEVNATLRNAFNYGPVSGKKIRISEGATHDGVTDSNGVANAVFTFNQTGIKRIKAAFGGDSIFLGSESEVLEIEVKPEYCSDGTAAGECSKADIGMLCLKLPGNGSGVKLVPNCAGCGCGSGLVCFEGECLTEEQRTTGLIKELQESVVYIQHTYATGSGVILSQGGGETVVLTTRHVVSDAVTIADVTVTANDGQNATAEKIRFAPQSMDFALVYLNGTYGKPAVMNFSETFQKGQAVVALGSPLGLQGSVSQGIISNFINDTTNTSYGFTYIQTDAPINPGNSGGGLFSKSTGTLAGINAAKIRTDLGYEGLGFAIGINELQALQPYENWGVFVPPPRCYDGTPYGQCSLNTGYYCSASGYFSEDCTRCGCGSGYSCLSTGKCFYCPVGDVFVKSGGEAICCPKGWHAYENDELFCCPPGEVGYEGGYCA